MGGVPGEAPRAAGRGDSGVPGERAEGGADGGVRAAAQVSTRSGPTVLVPGAAAGAARCLGDNSWF